ncbi:hypothetical protein F66182_6660 [Fusarium sp. NRRL 66182]|nr:hypothetical protein F66182_6660 [Fusarium sp. NRRL 66182]
MALKQLLAAASLGVFAQALAQQNRTSTGFKGCDALLGAGLEDILVFPEDAGYQVSVDGYYSSENRRLRPVCIAQPRSTADISSLLKTLSQVSAAGNWDIAVRSGGHSDYNNNAVNRGVTIDLSHMGNVTLAGPAEPYAWNGTSRITKSVARLQPGVRWANAMAELEPYNLAVTGGRSGHVGAAGLLVSGGASYHTQQWGLSCDNVVNYEVVLADGSVVEANAKENADLFKALKGGGLNLGIVSRFDLRTYTVPPNGVYGGLVFMSWSDLELANAQFLEYAQSSSGSPDHLFHVLQSSAGSNDLGIMAMAVSTDGKTDSKTFRRFKDMTLRGDRRNTQSLGSLSQTIADRGGSHYIPFTQILQAEAEILDKVADVFATLQSDFVELEVPVSLNFVSQPFPKNPATPAGPNILGLAKSLPADSILFEARGTLLAADATYEGIVRSKMAQAMEEIRAFSASLPGHSSYLYMNYANPEQDVIGSYGAENVEFLRKTAAKYDPTGFFQKRVPGGWKVSRVE